MIGPAAPPSFPLPRLTQFCDGDDPSGPVGGGGASSDSSSRSSSPMRLRDCLAPAAGHREAELLLGRGRRELTRDPALVDHEDPIGEREDLFELERDEEDGASRVALLDETAMDELDRADVQA